MGKGCLFGIGIGIGLLLVPVIFKLLVTLFALVVVGIATIL